MFETLYHSYLNIVSIDEHFFYTAMRVILQIMFSWEAERVSWLQATTVYRIILPTINRTIELNNSK
jgi:hypothetical protein